MNNFKKCNQNRTKKGLKLFFFDGSNGSSCPQYQFGGGGGGGE